MRRGEPERRSTRLRGYDYSTAGAYFITACTQDRLLLFGQVVRGEMAANRLGAVVEDCWTELPDHYDVALDAFMVMPNHVHGVIVIEDEPTAADAGAAADADVGAGFKPAFPTAANAKRHGVPEIIRAFKTFSARRINDVRGTPGAPVWQRGFYDRVLRSEAELNRVRTYIEDNPRKWSEDPDNPAIWPGRGRV